MKQAFGFIALLFLLSGCVNVGYLLVGRDFLFREGRGAKQDIFIRGEVRKFIQEQGDPDSYLWESYPVGYFKRVRILNLYYGSDVYIFKHNKLYARRKMWDWERLAQVGIYLPDYTVRIQSKR